MDLYPLLKLIRRLPGKVIRMVPMPEPEILEGFGARERITEVCGRLQCRSVLLVTDPTLLSLGFAEKVAGPLQNAGIRTEVFSGITSEPTSEMIREGREKARACGAECIIALGGGSVMDASKVIAASAKGKCRGVGPYLTKFVCMKTLPLITIPSTAGTGAEITVGAVVKNSRGVKNSSVIIGLNVPFVILDSELTVGAPAKITLGCGIDALSHGLEGCLADVRSSPEDIRKSRECVRLVFENLPGLMTDPGDVSARQRMALAANYGGNAINRQLAGYVHAFAHTLGAEYHLPHGEAIARCILPVIRDQEELCTVQLAELSRFCGFAAGEIPDREAAERFVVRLEALIRDSGFAEGLPQMEAADYGLLVSAIQKDSINYSPSKALKGSEIRRLLDEIREGF